MGFKQLYIGRIISSFAIGAVLVLSLSLLLYVGYGEARRTYPNFEIEKLASQAELVSNPLKTFVSAGLPLEQFPGFATVANPVLESDPTISTIYVARPNGDVIFSRTQPNSADAEPGRLGRFPTSEQPRSFYTVTENSRYYRVGIAIQNKLETAGYIYVVLPKAGVLGNINAAFGPLLALAGGLVLGFSVFVFMFTRRVPPGEKPRWIPTIYGVVFFVMAIAVIATLVNLYSGSVLAKTQALANSLGQRLSVPLRLGLSLDDLAKIDQTFLEYRKSNPELTYIALNSGAKVVLHTDPNRVGGERRDDPGLFERSAPVADTEQSVSLAVEVGVPQSLVFEKIWRGAKNFAALFIASLFISLIFFNLILAYRRYSLSARREPDKAALQGGLIAPIYFINVFADAIMNAFLPQHFKELAVKNGVDTGLVPFLFTTWFLAFALSLVPAGRLLSTGKLRWMFLLAGVATLAKPLGLFVFDDFYLMFLLQFLAGFGQGTTSVGVQSYLLQLATKSNATRNAGVIIWGYNGGVMAAVAIGGLLVVDPTLGREGVFLVGTVIALVSLVYIGLFVPRRIPVETPAASGGQRIGFWQSFSKTVKDFGFIKASVLISIPTKMISAGLITATLPALLATQTYQPEDIAQILMFYSGGVLIANRSVATLVDRYGRVAAWLFLGAVGSGVGLIVIGLSGAAGSPTVWLTIMLIVGLLGLGLAHGCTQAPSVTYVTGTDTAQRLGKASATSIYRLYERVGNVTGPVIVSQALALMGGSTVSIVIIGGVIIVFGLLFMLNFEREQPVATEVLSEPEPAQLAEASTA
jgi:MFS family permease